MAQLSSNHGKEFIYNKVPPEKKHEEEVEYMQKTDWLNYAKMLDPALT